MIKISYDDILTEAHEAAEIAVTVAKAHFNEMAGACGFAWVKIDGNDGLARHCRKMLKSEVGQSPQFRREYEIKYGGKGYPTGWQFWNPGNHNGQRIDIKEAGARAFMNKLAEYGIRADFGSRLD